ncbi:MAG: uracil phosphoribosyltransferase [Chloroflexi bacterium]|nr:uracil phosphoribosyltransferase [Chloroflexota bacterium]
MRGVSQPTASQVRQYPQLQVSSHPLIVHKLTLLRQVDTGVKQFDDLVTELAWLLAYEATAESSLRPATARTPLESTDGGELSDRIGLVPILRAGLSLVGAFRALIPSAQVWHLGLYRDEATLRSVEYYSRIPERDSPDVGFVLDPMLATGGSAIAAVEALESWGIRQIEYVGLIAAPYGVEQLVRRFPHVRIHVAALDRELNDQGYILPGLGDAGDRQFGTSSG